MPSAIETMKIAIQSIQSAMAKCRNSRGFIKDECRSKYNKLDKKAQAFHESIDWLEQLYKEPHQDPARTSPCWPGADEGRLMMDEYDIVKDK